MCKTKQTADAKKCNECGEVKPLGEYHKNGKNVDGSPRFRSACKPCASASKKTAKDRRKANQRLVHLFDLPNQEGTSPSKRYAIFKCSCFNFHRARKYSVKDGTTSSCGCTSREVKSKDLSHFQGLADGNPSTKGLVLIGKERRGNHTYLKINCPEYNWTGWQHASDLSTGKNPCPDCRDGSRMNKWSLQLCKELSLDFKAEARFDECRSKGILPFDVAIFDESGKTIACIEAQGKQHFTPQDFGGKGKAHAQEALEGTQRRDQIKRDFCEREGIALIEIDYHQRDFTNADHRTGEWFRYALADRLFEIGVISYKQLRSVSQGCSTFEPQEGTKLLAGIEPRQDCHLAT